MVLRLAFRLVSHSLSSEKSLSKSAVNLLHIHHAYSHPRNLRPIIATSQLTFRAKTSTQVLCTGASRPNFPDCLCQANNYALQKQAEQLSKFAASQLLAGKDTSTDATTKEETSKSDSEEKKEQDEEPQTDPDKDGAALEKAIADLEERLKQVEEKLRTVQTELDDKVKLIEQKNERIVSLQKENNLLNKEKRQLQDELPSAKKQK